MVAAHVAYIIPGFFWNRLILLSNHKNLNISSDYVKINTRLELDNP